MTTLTDTKHNTPDTTYYQNIGRDMYLIIENKLLFLWFLFTVKIFDVTCLCQVKHWLYSLSYSENIWVLYTVIILIILLLYFLYINFKQKIQDWHYQMVFSPRVLWLVIFHAYNLCFISIILVYHVHNLVYNVPNLV